MMALTELKQVMWDMKYAMWVGSRAQLKTISQMSHLISADLGLPCAH
jgi:hypothetical protein